MPRKKVSAPAAAAPAPQPPQTSPAVLQLQAKVADLIDQREQAMDAVTVAQGELHMAQAKVQTATSKVQQIDQMVQYRMGVIAQMENRTQHTQVVPFPSQSFDQSFTVTSEPTVQTQSYMGDPNDRVNRAHASRADAGDIVRRAL